MVLIKQTISLSSNYNFSWQKRVQDFFLETIKEENTILVPDDILKEANATRFNLLPQKFRIRYIKELEGFGCGWRTEI